MLSKLDDHDGSSHRSTQDGQEENPREFFLSNLEIRCNYIQSEQGYDSRQCFHTGSRVDSPRHTRYRPDDKDAPVDPRPSRESETLFHRAVEHKRAARKCSYKPRN